MTRGRTARGPAPTPTPILKLRGSTVPGRRAAKGQLEPTAPDARPRMPSWLDRRAKAEWKRVVPLLEVMGVLSSVDQSQLAAYCRTWSLWRATSQSLEDPRLDAKQYQAAAHAFSRLQGELLRWSQEFGLTPSSRTRLNVEKRREDPNAKRNALVFG